MLHSTECGITINGKTRGQDHFTSKNSNPLMKLTEAVCKDMWAEGCGIDYFPVYNIHDVKLASLSEALITTIVQAYYSNGGGFSTEPAGRSVRTI